jgi:cytochrome c biogenesis protein CcmG, thiol:disulfide interchange protein DsbE
MTTSNATKATRPGAARTPSGSQRRAAARKKAAARRRLLAFGVPAGAVALVAVVAILVTAGGGPGKSSAPGTVQASGAPRATRLQAGDAIPSFSAPGLSGGTISWQGFAGKPVVLVAWAPWCPHCQAELPVLDRVAREYPTVGLVTVVTDIGLHPGPAPEAFMSDNGLSFPVAVDDESRTIALALGISEFPTIYFVGPDGMVRVSTVGEMPESTLRAQFDALAALAG